MTKKMNFKVFLFIAVTMLCFSFLHSETIAQPPSNYDENDAGTHFNPYLISNLANLRWLSETPSVWGSQTHRFFFKQTENIEAADTENWNQGLGFSAIGKMSAYFFGIYDGGNYHIHNLYSNVHGTDEITGMFGMINRATIENVHLRDANIKGGLYYGTGSLVTFAQNSLIRWCSVSGNVYNENCFGDVGGLVGYTHATDIYHCYSLTYINVGNVRSLGGLVGFLGFNSFLRFGYFNGIIINEIPSSSMDYYNVGGVVGWSTEAELRNIYAASKTPFQHNMSGIVGRADTWTTVYDAHWDICTTGKTNGVYIVFPTSIVDAIGFSTSEMKSTISYSNSQGWDFINTWIIDNSINEGYPSFKENIAEKPINFYEINSGSEQNPFLISNIFNLKWLSEAREFWGNANRQFYFLQTQDINAIVTKYWNGEEGFIPIGIRRVVANEIRFRGVYDGGNYRISNLYIKQRVVPYHDINTALFGSIEFSTIKNINLVNVDITGSWGVAALVGSATASTISNCSTSGVVKHILAPTVSYVFRSPGGASGLIGSGEWDTIVKGSHSNVTIIGENAGNVGGIAASLAQSDISNSYFYGNIDYDAYSIEYVAGGLVGVISFNSNISNSYVASKDPFVDAFGLVGRVINSSISKTYWDIQTTGTSEAYRDNENGAFDDVQGYSTEEMKIQESFTGWDFVDIWNIRHGINAGYPFLRGLPIPVVLLPVVNLSADVDGNVVLLKWEAPEFGMENGQWRMENDNHTYPPASTEASSGTTWVAIISTLIGYEVYRDNVLLTSAPFSELTFIDSDVENGVYIYGVVVVYEEGRSEAVEIEVKIDTFSLPNPVVLLAPVNEVIEVDLRPVFTWELPIDGGEIAGLRFYIESEHIVSHLLRDCFGVNSSKEPLNDDVGGNSIILPADTTEYSMEIDLDYKTTYYWSVIAFNEYGDSIGNQVFNFTTKEYVSDKDENTLPLITELFPNFPNPFNPETTIRFNVAVESIVSIDIYNIRGQRVKRLFEGFYERGSHTVVWDGRDDSDKELGSGVYLYRMIAGDVVETKRMVLLK